jgi:hypothetical protein
MAERELALQCLKQRGGPRKSDSRIRCKIRQTKRGHTGMSKTKRNRYLPLESYEFRANRSHLIGSFNLVAFTRSGGQLLKLRDFRVILYMDTSPARLSSPSSLQFLNFLLKVFLTEDMTLDSLMGMINEFKLRWCMVGFPLETLTFYMWYN